MVVLIVVGRTANHGVQCCNSAGPVPKWNKSLMASNIDPVNKAANHVDCWWRQLSLQWCWFRGRGPFMMRYLLWLSDRHCACCPPVFRGCAAVDHPIVVVMSKVLVEISIEVRDSYCKYWRETVSCSTEKRSCVARKPHEKTFCITGCDKNHLWNIL